MLSAVFLAALFTSANAECPNACSAHGRCGAYDMCTCYRNWMSNDCSERICQFGLAHVDTPKGDLDSSSGALTGPSVTVATNSDMYPYGTSEQFPNMLNSDQAALTNTAHYYMECSNKGVCDRQTGLCNCFEGYSGSACQRASCPDTGNGVCSGHGTCESIATIADWDHHNYYRLWDKDVSMGCVCDGGYQGANCEEKICKFGADPLYLDNHQTIRYSNWTYTIYTTANSVTVTGNYSLVFTDATGEDWATGPIDIAATCPDVVAAIEAIPNNVFESGATVCQVHGTPHTSATDYYDLAGTVYAPFSTSTIYRHSKYTIAFPSNPGYMETMRVNINLDGNRPTLYTDETTSTLGTYVYSNGFYGENDDFVPDLCENVVVYLTAGTGLNLDSLNPSTAAEKKLLKACLGDADGDSTNNIETYNWDYGSQSNPHLVKLIDRTNTLDASVDSDPTHIVSKKSSVSFLCAPYTGSVCNHANTPGFYVAMFYDNTNDAYYIFGRPAYDYSSSTPFWIYTTKGYLSVTNSHTNAFNTWLSSNINQYDHYFSNILYTRDSSATAARSKSDLSCETGTSNAQLLACLNKGDYIMVLNTNLRWNGAGATLGNNVHAFSAGSTAAIASNAIYPQIYQVKKIAKETIPPAHYALSKDQATTWSNAADAPTFIQYQIVVDKPFNTDFHFDPATAASDTSATVYKFTPPSNAYTYAAQCSNRGLCDTNSGLCNCFSGFTGDNCDSIDALHA